MRPPLLPCLILSQTVRHSKSIPQNTLLLFRWFLSRFSSCFSRKTGNFLHPKHWGFLHHSLLRPHRILLLKQSHIAQYATFCSSFRIRMCTSLESTAPNKGHDLRTAFLLLFRPLIFQLPLSRAVSPTHPTYRTPATVDRITSQHPHPHPQPIPVPIASLNFIFHHPAFTKSNNVGVLWFASSRRRYQQPSR